MHITKNYTKSMESACSQTKNMKCLSVVTQHLVKPLVVYTVLQLVILMSVYLPERRLNIQLNQPGPPVLNN